MKKILAFILVLTSFLSCNTLLINANAKNNSSDLSLYESYKECIENVIPLCKESFSKCISNSDKISSKVDICYENFGHCLKTLCNEQFLLDRKFRGSYIPFPHLSDSLCDLARIIDRVCNALSQGFKYLMIFGFGVLLDHNLLYNIVGLLNQN